tara:strand:- start:5192 stop:6352 length:1161 start_codon:yes stop_codon:yes gene_type:complete
MIKKIAILGSTGSIGKNLIKILKKEKNRFKIILLSANKNYRLLLKQVKSTNVENVIITDKKSFQNFLKKNKNKNLKIYNSFNELNKIFKNKVDYTMGAISGLQGLAPTLGVIKYTKKLALANKESIICGWNLINKELKKYNTEFIPVDSEHFSIWYALKGNKEIVENIILTASGGPLNKVPLNQIKNVKISQALNHPNWSMGKKISIDSATMMNKVFEIIEAKNIFNIDYKELMILIHPSSYVHALIKFKNGIIKIVAHDTDMKIPIFNTLDVNFKKKIKTNKINISKLNDLRLKKVDKRKFPLTKILSILPEKSSLFETVIVSANDELVKLFLNNKIKFTEISKKLLWILKNKEFKKYKRFEPKNISQIIKLNNYVRLKINPKSI